MDNKYLTARQVAEYLNVSESSIRKWVQRGQIPRHRFGKLVRFNSKEIELWGKMRKVLQMGKHDHEPDDEDDKDQFWRR